jgi:tRNA threonylcarbamoyladenosine biosynthesis protein TsaE
MRNPTPAQPYPIKGEGFRGAAISLPTAEATEAFGAALAERLRPGDVVALFGTLGAGKTTLARGILRGLGHQGDVASPTFPIVQTYEPPATRLAAWHVDLYRIEQAAELEELGLDEAKQAGVLLIEWPDRLPVLWPETLRLRLEIAEGDGRALTAGVPPAWGSRWPPR